MRYLAGGVCQDMARDELSVFTTGDGCTVAYRIDGPPAAPVLVLSNSIGTTMGMWDAQLAALSQSFRVLRYDTRGHGASGAPAGPYSLDRLGYDVVELLDALGLDRVHFCGLSLGGFIGQWLGYRQPSRIDHLILANTAAHLEPRSFWDGRIADVLAAGDLTEIANSFLRNWFPANMLDPLDEAVIPFQAGLLAMNPFGLAGCYAAVRDTDLRATGALITRPTLVVAGEFDTVTTLAHGEFIASAVPGARLVTLPVVHLSNVEQPREFLEATLEFLPG